MFNITVRYIVRFQMLPAEGPSQTGLNMFYSEAMEIHYIQYYTVHVLHVELILNEKTYNVSSNNRNLI